MPVEVDPDAAREAAARELADPAYAAAEPSFPQQVFERIGRFLGDVLSAVGDVAPGGLVGAMILLLLAVVVFIVIRLRVGPLARSLRSDVVTVDRGRSSEDYRQAAEAARDRGDLGTAVRERFRAIVRELDGRGVLDERSGRTVDEIAAQAGQRLPHRASELRAAATLFDDVVYGGHPPTEAGYDAVAALDTALQAERPAMAAR
ncbi:DUF4129 domain-containing protein [Actinophytocola sp.]|uniref:DUF4129 domain-containing protein n=1 Tax=Actinophytocola sp. TaxID=1872138 RepID=UPI002ED5C925